MPRTELTQKTEPTVWVRIYSAGDIATAKQVIREYCWDVGLCATIEPASFIYTGGEESGFVVQLINYPRFPAGKQDIRNKAAHLARMIMERCHQWSSLIMDTEETEWLHREIIDKR